MIRLLRIATVFLLASACRVDDRDEAPQSAAEQSAPAPSVSGSAAYTIAELQALRYLEGDWRGSGYEGGPFYESYRFVAAPSSGAPCR
jgi:hypothetical protein